MEWDYFMNANTGSLIGWDDGAGEQSLCESVAGNSTPDTSGEELKKDEERERRSWSGAKFSASARWAEEREKTLGSEPSKAGSDAIQYREPEDSQLRRQKTARKFTSVLRSYPTTGIA